MSGTVPAASGIYCILNEITGKLYIGSAVSLRRRKQVHFRNLSNGCHPNQYLQHSFNKYGIDVFSFHIIELVDDEELLTQREQCYMNETESYKRENGYNLRPTADTNLGFRHSDETKAKISAASKKRSKQHSDAIRSEKNPFWGKRHSEEVKARISKVHKGKKLSDQTRAKMSAAHLGKKFSDKHRQKLSKASLRWWKEYYSEQDKLQLVFDF